MFTCGPLLYRVKRVHNLSTQVGRDVGIEFTPGAAKRFRDCLSANVIVSPTEAADIFIVVG